MCTCTVTRRRDRAAAISVRPRGGRFDRWRNDDYAGVHCYPDHVDIDTGDGVDPRGVHRIGSNLFRFESTIDGPSPPGDGDAYLVTLSVGIRTGGPEARAGIAVQPYPPLDVAIDGISYSI